MKKASTEPCVLITNLMDVSIETGFGSMRTHTNALVLMDEGPDAKAGPRRYRAYGFHNEAGNPTFDLVLPSFEWSIEPQSYQRRFLLCFAGSPEPGPRMALLTDFANDLPLDIERFEGEDARRGWGDVLVRKVLRYYHAPYFILGQQHETVRVRQVLGVEGVVRV